MKVRINGKSVDNPVMAFLVLLILSPLILGLLAIAFVMVLSVLVLILPMLAMVGVMVVMAGIYEGWNWIKRRLIR